MLSFVEYTCTYKKKWKHLLINADTGSASLTTSDHWKLLSNLYKRYHYQNGLYTYLVLTVLHSCD